MLHVCVPIDAAAGLADAQRRRLLSSVDVHGREHEESVSALVARCHQRPQGDANRQRRVRPAQVHSALRSRFVSISFRAAGNINLTI